VVAQSVTLRAVCDSSRGLWLFAQSVTLRAVCGSLAFTENASEDLRFTQCGTHDENRDGGEVDSQDRALVQDSPRNRKRNGVNAKYNETIIATEKQKAKFLEEAIKNRQPENENLLFFFSQPFAPRQRTGQYEIAFHKPHPTSCWQFAYPPVSSSFQHCPFAPSPSPSPHLHLTVHHQKQLTRRLVPRTIPVRTTRFTSKCHPSAAHPNPTNTTQWVPKSSVCIISSSNTKFI